MTAPYVLSLCNQKGGVGKTSTVFHLAGTLASVGRARVLVVDNDPQASLTQGFFGPEATADLDPNTTIVRLYRDWADRLPRTALAALVRPTGFDRVDLLPGSLALNEFNGPVLLPPSAVADEDFNVFQPDLLASDGYDLVIVDNPPNILRCTMAALGGSDGVLVPLQAEDFGAQGITAVEAAIGSTRLVGNPGLDLVGYLITMFPARTALHRHYESVLRMAKGEAVFETTVPDTVEFAEAVMRRRPVIHHRPRGKGAESIRRLAVEILRRIRPPAATSWYRLDELTNALVNDMKGTA